MRYDLMIGSMEWSYSRLTAYEDCPYLWLQRYIFRIRGQSKFFAQYGSLIDLTTNKPEDRRKLIVMDVFPLKSKKDNSIWGYAIQTRSIGSGKTSRLTLRSRIYDKKPIKRFDVIFASDVQKERSGYWYLIGYDYVI